MFDFNIIKKSINDLTGALKKTQLEIESKKQRREQLQTLPPCKADVLEMMMGYIDKRAAVYPERFLEGIKYYMRKPLELSKCDDHGYIAPRVIDATDNPDDFANVRGAQENMFFLFGDQIKNGLKKAIDAVDWPQSGPPIAERFKEIAELDTAIAELEEKEAEICQQARNAGIHIDRVKPVAVRPASERFTGGTPISPANKVKP